MVVDAVGGTSGAGSVGIVVVEVEDETLTALFQTFGHAARTIHQPDAIGICFKPCLERLLTDAPWGEASEKN